MNAAKVSGCGCHYVQVAPPVAAEFKGNVPVIQTEAWLAGSSKGPAAAP
jgi:hypothetical protein